MHVAGTGGSEMQDRGINQVQLRTAGWVEIMRETKS
jgi:hypothetical protein